MRMARASGWSDARMAIASRNARGRAVPTLIRRLDFEQHRLDVACHAKSSRRPDGSAKTNREPDARKQAHGDILARRPQSEADSDFFGLPRNG